MKIKRRKSREIKIGNVRIGGNNPVIVQSMAKTFTSDFADTLKEIKELQNSGCQIIRLAVRDNQDIAALKKIKQRINIPLVADIHFDKNLALKAIASGVDKIRLNPGNIYKKNEIKEIVKAAKQARIAIRVGVNSGSLRCRSGIRGKNQTSGGRSQEAQLMVKSALDYIRLLEGFGFYDIVVSIKSSDVFATIQANERIAESCDYPLHLGVTATGPSFIGVIKSTLVIGRLLFEGIGDTIRISLSDKAIQEVRTGNHILQALGLQRGRPEIISCPTCGRCEVDLIKIVEELDKRITESLVHSSQFTDKNYRLPLKVAIMGCVVNGPGEARVADLGIAFGRKQGLLFSRGKPIRKIAFGKCVDALLHEMHKSKN